MAIGSTTSAQLQNPSALRWLLPSIVDLFFIALLVLLSCTALSVRLLGDAGIGWHIRTGQIILSTHVVPHVDSFSTFSGQPWFAWEWLYDLIVGWLEAAAGLNAVVLFTAAVIATVFACVFRLLVSRGTNVLLAVILVLLAASASMIHFLARPHVLSWLFALAWFWILDSFENVPVNLQARSSRLVYWFPITMLLWVNLHGGFLLGFALLGIYCISATWDSLTPSGGQFEDALRQIQAGKRARTLLLAGSLSALATLLNPYGWRLHLHIYRYLSNRFLMDHIDEFQSPNFHYVAQKCFAGLLLLALVAVALKVEPRTHSSGELAKNLRLSHVLILLFAIYSALYSSRNIPVSSLLLILVTGPRLSTAMEALFTRLGWHSASSFSQRMQALESSLRGHLWAVTALAFICWIAAQHGKLGSTPVMDAHFSQKRFPIAAVNILTQQHAEGAILCPDFWGGYLIYRLHPRLQVVVDDRHDFYGEQFLKSYLQMVNAEPGWKDFLKQHPAGYLLLPKDSAFSNLLLETPGYTPLYRDEVAIAFSRSDHPSN